MATEPHAPPRWRREPYRVLFPLGAALGSVAVLPFVAGGAGGGALGLFHPLAQIEGFLSCFLTGFLFTFMPRGTGTPAPGPWEMGAALALPPACAASAWAGRGELAHGLWLVLVAGLIRFTVRRARATGARPPWPAAFVWVPLSVLAGVAGALLAALSPLVSETSAPRAWTLGRGLLGQGLVTGLVLGGGATLLPRLVRGEAADALPPARLRRAAALHAIAALAFFGSFPVEVLYDARLGMVVRALVATLVLVFAAGIHRAPTLPGVPRRLVWTATWLLPVGFWLAALAPRLRTAALHVVFVGGFTQLALAVAAHVVLSRGGRGPALEESPWTAGAVAALLALAFGARLAAAIDLARIPFWLAVAGMAFVGALLAWAALVRPVTTASGGSP